MKRIVLAALAVSIASLLLGSDILQAQGPLSQTTAVPLAKGWTATWGGSLDDGGGRAAVDAWGNVYVAGQFSGEVDFDPAPAITDTHTSSNGSIDAYLSKYDSRGQFLWAKTWGGDKRDVAYDVSVDGAGNAYVVGPFRGTVDFNPDPAITETYSSNAISGTIFENNIYLSKFTPDGTLLWVRTWGPALIPGRYSFGAEGYTVAVDGNYLYVVGDFSGDQTDFDPWGNHDWHQNHLPPSGPVFFDAFLVKFDLDGNFQWAKTWGGEGYDDGPGVAVDSLGNVYVAGMYASQDINFDPAGGPGGLGHPAHDSGILVDVFLSKFDSDGNFQWVKTWGGQGTDDAMGTVVVDRMDRVYVAGRFASVDCDFDPEGMPDLHSTNGLFDAFVSKFDANGVFQWARTWGGPDDDMAMGLAVDGWNHVYVSGWFASTVDMDPGDGVDNHTSNGGHDVFLSQFDPGGSLDWARTWGGSGEDSSGIAVDWQGVNSLYATGKFADVVDFDPGSGVDPHTSNGGEDAFLSQFLFQSYATYLPLVAK
jgi:hypothetical protein